MILRNLDDLVKAGLKGNEINLWSGEHRDIVKAGKLNVEINIDDKIIEFLKYLKNNFIKYYVSSGYRTAEWNKKIGGVENSLHLSGKAVDLLYADSYNLHKIVKAGIEILDGGIGINKYRGFVHLDTGKQKIWVYDK